jgi:hypothetical protein
VVGRTLQHSIADVTGMEDAGVDSIVTLADDNMSIESMATD